VAENISIQEATALAKSGDADAQYALSSVMHQRGQFDESLFWLRQAAAQKLIAAQMTLATILMDGRQCARDVPQAIELLQPLAATQMEANLLLSELHGFAALQIADRETGRCSTQRRDAAMPPPRMPLRAVMPKGPVAPRNRR
jgi:TPR repeat protein